MKYGTRSAGVLDIAPRTESQVGEKTIRHRLAAWYAHQPEGHALLS